MRRLLLPACAFALVWFSAPTAARALTLTVEVLPAAPTTVNPVTVKIGILNRPAYRFYADRYGSQIIIHLQNDCVLAACPEFDQVFEVPLGLLPADAYYGQVWVDGFIEEEFDFEVEEGAAGPLPPAHFSLELAPTAPNDAERTRLLITSETCAPATLEGWTRQGQTVVARLGLAPADPDCELPVAERVLGLEMIDLGQLEPGGYLAELRTGPGAATLLQSRSFTVQDAGDAVTLLGRYRVALTWKTRDGQTGSARPTALRSAESALFSFFDPGNWEVLVKVLDGCAINNHRWVFLAAATDVEFTLEVTDLEAAAPPYVYTSPAGLFTPPLADTAAFACSP